MRRLYAIIFVMLAAVAAHAQSPSLATITGTVYKYDQATATIIPASGAILYLKKIVKNGVIVSAPGDKKITADSNGGISFSVPRASVITLQGDVIIGGSDLTSPNGKAFTVPDSASATIESLALAATATTTGIPVKISNTLQTNKAITLDFGSGLTVTESPGGEYNVSSAVISSITITDALGYVPLSPANNLSELASASTARTNLGLGTAATKDAPSSGNASSTQVVLGSDTRLTDARTPTSHVHSESDVTNLTSDLAAKASAAALTSEASTRSAADALKADKGAGYIGMVAIAEVNQDRALSGLPVIDSYQVQDNDRVLLLNQTDQKENGVWVAHSGAWARPADFANGSVHPSGSLIFVRGNGVGQQQMFSSWMQLDNSVDDQATFTVGTDGLNSLSRSIERGLGDTDPIPQGPVLDMSTWGRTDSSSEIGKGYALALQPIDFGGVQLVNAPEPVNAQDLVTKNYVDAVQAAADSGLASKQSADADLTAIAGLTPTNDDVIQRKAGAWTNRTPAQLKTDLALTSSDVALSSVTNDAQTKASIVPNTLPVSGQILVGNVGGTAYAKQSLSGDCTLASTGGITCTKTSGVSFATSATTDTTNAANIGSGTLSGSRLPALTGGDVTSSAGSTTLTIGAGRVTNSMLAGSIDLTTKVTGALPIGNGGTGQTAKAAAFDALSPNTTLGDVTYHNGTNSVRLAGNTTTTQKFLAQTGNGTVSAAPGWVALASGDIPTIDASKAGISYGRVTGSNVTTTGQSLVDITGLSVSLAANTSYEVECWLSAASSDTNGNQYAIQYSAAGATIEAGLIGTFSATAVRTDRFSAFNTASGNRYLQVAGDGEILIKAVVTTGANSGSLTAQHLKATSGTSTVRIGSYLKVTKIS